MFVTMALAVLDPARPGRVSLASGGHPPAFVLAPPRPVQEIAVEGDILGAFPEARFHQRELALAPGSTLLLMTDGLLEGAGVGGSRTGLPGLRPLLEALQERPLPGLVEGLVGVAPGRGGVPRDDVTVVALRR
jgi:sigma-B regulation protein RsbU (phosphoserine phosphatase)